MCTGTQFGFFCESTKSQLKFFMNPDIFQHPAHHIQAWDSHEFQEAGIEVSVLRGDLFHPWIQGNKWYKLRHFVEKCLIENNPGFISIGGAWSNHLLALANIASNLGKTSRFLVRGEIHEWDKAPAVQQMRSFGAELRPVSRNAFKEILSGKLDMKTIWPESGDDCAVPLGASATETVKHVADWAKHISGIADFTDILIPAASGGTSAGFLAGLNKNCRLHSVEVLRSGGGIELESLRMLSESKLEQSPELIWHDQYHFGGYAKQNSELFDFQLALEQNFQLPTEHVYSGKLFFAVSDLARKRVFSEGSKILTIHTGGLFPWNGIHISKI